MQIDPGVASSRSKGRPSGNGLLHRYLWYRRRVGLYVSGSRPPESLLKSNEVSISIPRGSPRKSTAQHTGAAKSGRAVSRATCGPTA